MEIGENIPLAKGVFIGIGIVITKGVVTHGGRSFLIRNRTRSGLKASRGWFASAEARVKSDLV